MTNITLKSGKAKPFWHHHPWVYSGTIAKIEGNPQSADWVTVVDHQQQFVAKGIWDADSQISVRLWTWDPEESLEDFLQRKIKAAVHLRRQLLNLPSVTTAYRLIHSEGDGISGLIIDQYNDHLIVQWSVAGMERYQPLIEEILQSPIKTKKETDEILEVVEHGVKFQVNIKESHKTGFYCDQRDNRLLLSTLTKPKRVLDAFCYTGGFGVYLAAKTDPEEIVFLDDSQTALTIAKQNLAKNSSVAGIFKKANVFRYLEEMIKTKEQFDTIILDPPKLAPNQKSLPSALKALQKLQTQALQLLSPNGILVTCDCSGDISMEMFVQTLQMSALETNRDVRILKTSNAGPDHPINPCCPQNAYLKVLFCQ